MCMPPPWASVPAPAGTTTLSVMLVSRTVTTDRGAVPWPMIAIPPAAKCARFARMEQPIRNGDESVTYSPPPQPLTRSCRPASLSVNVTRSKIGVPPITCTPPPNRAAPFDWKVQSAKMTPEVSTKAPPPSMSAWFPVKTQCRKTAVASATKSPPPYPPLPPRPPVTVMPSTTTLAPQSRMRTVSPPPSPSTMTEAGLAGSPRSVIVRRIEVRFSRS